MAKLTDTQLIVLSNAAQRDDGAAVLPDRMVAATAKKVGSSLVSRKLIREIRAKTGMPIWRKGDDDRPMSLVLLKAGRDAIGVEDAGPESPPEVAPRAIAAKGGKGGPQRLDPLPRTGTKQALVIGMLSKDTGVTLDALIAATRWLPHTTRAVLSGLRKRGFQIERSREEAHGSVYRIVGGQKQTAV